MKNVIDIEMGDRPWAPVDSEIVDVLDSYDGPQIAVLRQHGNYYLMQVVIDTGTGNGLWAYTAIDEGHCESLKQANDDAFDELVDQFLVHTVGRLAAVTSDRVVDVADILPMKSDDPVGTAINELVDRAEDRGNDSSQAALALA